MVLVGASTSRQHDGDALLEVPYRDDGAGDGVGMGSSRIVGPYATTDNDVDGLGRLVLGTDGGVNAGVDEPVPLTQKNLLMPVHGSCFTSVLIGPPLTFLHRLTSVIVPGGRSHQRMKGLGQNGYGRQAWC